MGTLSAEGAIIEAPKAPREVRSGEGVSPFPSGGFFDFLSGNGAFWAVVLMLV